MSELPAVCADVDGDLSALIDEELSAAREAEVRAHLEVCASCRARFAALAEVDLVLAGASAPPVPADLRARLQTRLDASPISISMRVDDASRARLAPRRRRMWRPALGLALAAAAALALYLAVVARPPTPMGVGPQPQVARETPRASDPARNAVARRESPTAAPRAPTPTPPAPRVAGAEAPTPQAPDDWSDEEVAVALQLDTISDFDVIANLDALEELLALEEAG
jgi:negative regulator of sigma E activity